jgi:MerR family transcriptional regulator, copper efflux regulator
LLKSSFMRITEAARRLGTSARMLRYREDLGLLPQVRDGFGPTHRQFGEEDVAAVAATLALERRYDISPASLAFGLRVLAEPGVRAAVSDLGRRLGRIPAPASRAVDFEKERALRLLQGRLGGRSVTGRETRCNAGLPARTRPRPDAPSARTPPVRTLPPPGRPVNLTRPASPAIRSGCRSRPGHHALC